MADSIASTPPAPRPRGGRVHDERVDVARGVRVTGIRGRSPRRFGFWADRLGLLRKLGLIDLPDRVNALSQIPNLEESSLLRSDVARDGLAHESQDHAASRLVRHFAVPHHAFFRRLLLAVPNERERLSTENGNDQPLVVRRSEQAKVDNHVLASDHRGIRRRSHRSVGRSQEQWTALREGCGRGREPEKESGDSSGNSIERESHVIPLRRVSPLQRGARTAGNPGRPVRSPCGGLTIVPLG
jgi:hypothetical protein